MTDWFTSVYLLFSPSVNVYLSVINIIYFQVEPIIQKGHDGLVHHILLYECSRDFPRAFLNHSGRCYDEKTTPEAIMKCAGESTVAAWAIGGGVRNFRYNINSLTSCTLVIFEVFHHAG